MLKYKLTNQNNETFGKTKWGVGVTHETNGSGGLCSPGWLHYYHTPELAVLLNPIHAKFANPKLWECDAQGEQLDDFGLKGGCTKLTTIREIPLPECSTEQRIEFGIRCALEVYHDDGFVVWAKSWLDGSDRSRKSADKAADAAWLADAAADAAAYAATCAAALAAACAAAWEAARAAVRAARAAACAAAHTGANAANRATVHPSFKPDRLAAIAIQVLAKAS